MRAWRGALYARGVSWVFVFPGWNAHNPVHHCKWAGVVCQERGGPFMRVTQM
jgi:hypothetical protein